MTKYSSASRKRSKPKRARVDNTERDRRILELRAGGARLRAIGEQMNLSVERVRGIIAHDWRRNLDPKDVLSILDRISLLVPSARIGYVVMDALRTPDWWRENIFTAEAAAQAVAEKITRTDLLNMNNIGKRTIADVESWLATFGFALRDGGA